MSSTQMERHKKFVEDARSLADKEGKAIAGAALSMISQLLVMSGGSINKFLVLVKAAKAKIIGESVARAKLSKTRAASLGAAFGKTK